MPERLIRFGSGALAELPDVCTALGCRRPLLVTTARGVAAARGLEFAGVYDGVLPHVPVETVRAAAELARSCDADALVGLGGGSAIDTCKAVAADLLPERTVRVVAVPTTYAGAEWTPYFGFLLAPGRKGGARDERVRPAAAIYDPELTLGLGLGVTVGTSMNALAHCAEATYHPATTEHAMREADLGAAAIARALPQVVDDPAGIETRTELLGGAMHAALALDGSGLCLAHAMAQGLGGRYGLPQGTMNALCLAPALRFNAEVVPAAVARFGRALGVDDVPTGVESLAALGRFGRLRDHDIPSTELASVAEEIAERPGAKANPRPATPAEIEELLRSIW